MRTGLIILLFQFTLWAGAHSQTLQSFTLPNATSGGNISLSDYQGKKGLVIIFTSNYCPYSKLYDGRITQWVDTYNTAEVQFLLINPNSKYHPEYESLEEMKSRASEKGYTVPYLSDADQVVANNLQATRTPEVFVMRKVGDSFRVVYRGALDDNPQMASDVQNSYLTDALEALVKGQPMPTHQRATGCMIKKG